MSPGPRRLQGWCERSPEAGVWPGFGQGLSDRAEWTGANCLAPARPLVEKTDSPEVMQLLLKYLLVMFINPASIYFPIVPLIKIWARLSEGAGWPQVPGQSAAN